MLKLQALGTFPIRRLALGDMLVPDSIKNIPSFSIQAHKWWSFSHKTYCAVKFGHTRKVEARQAVRVLLFVHVISAHAESLAAPACLVLNSSCITQKTAACNHSFFSGSDCGDRKWLECQSSLQQVSVVPKKKWALWYTYIGGAITWRWINKSCIIIIIKIPIQGLKETILKTVIKRL